MADLDWNAPMGAKSDGVRSKYPEIFGGGSAVPQPGGNTAGAPPPPPPGNDTTPAPIVGSPSPGGTGGGGADRAPGRKYTDMPSEEYWRLAGSNIKPGLERVAAGLEQMATSPVESAKALGSLGVDLATGLGSKAIDVVGEATGYGPVLDPNTKQERERVADAAFEHFNYLSDKEEFWKRLAEDPVSIGLDVATFAPVAGVAGRAAGLGKLATGVEKVAALGDPVNLAMQGAKLGVKAVTRPVAAVTRYPQAVATGTPIQALKIAGQTGRSTDPGARQAFRSTMAGDAEPRDIARAAVAAMEEKRRAASDFYTSKKRELTTQELSMGEIRRTLDDALSKADPYGLRSNAADVAALREMDNLIRGYETSPNPGARTAVQLDRLKRDLRGIVNQLGPSERGGVAAIPNAVRDTIAKVDPTYAKMMDYWQEWISTMRDMQATFGTGDRVSETARLAKLMSTMKSGEKLNLLKQLGDTPSGKYLPEMIAGAAFRDIMPAAMQGFGLGVLGPVLAGGPHGIAAAAAASPRLAGMAQYGLGRLEGAVNAIPKPPAAITNAMYQTTGDRTPRKSGGRVGGDHSAAADQLVRAAERAKKELGRSTEPLLSQSDDTVAHALEVANRSI